MSVAHRLAPLLLFALLTTTIHAQACVPSAGTYCPASTGAAVTCPTGYDCTGDPQNDPIACPTGTFNSQTGQSSAAACQAYSKRYARSDLVDSFWYIIGYCEFATGRHQAAFHAAGRAQPVHAPALVAQGLGHGQARKDVATGTAGHHQLFNFRAPAVHAFDVLQERINLAGQSALIRAGLRRRITRLLHRRRS